MHKVVVVADLIPQVKLILVVLAVVRVLQQLLSDLVFLVKDILAELE